METIEITLKLPKMVWHFVAAALWSRAITLDEDAERHDDEQLKASWRSYAGVLRSVADKIREELK